MSKKTLVVYFTYSNGNTKKIAELVQSALDADIAVIEPITPYTGTYDEVVEQGQKEVVKGYKPPIQPLTNNLADYDTVAVGTPTWWYTMAPAVLTFLAENDWNGKTVIPFMTNGGWPGHVIKDIKNACKGANCIHEKQVRFDSSGGDQMITSQVELNVWLEQLKTFIDAR